MNYALGIDLGGTHIKLAAYEVTSRNNLGNWTAPTRDGEREGDLPAFAFEVRKAVAYVEKELGQAADAVGLASPGLATPDNRAIAFMPGRLEGLEHFDWGAHLGRPGEVPVLNDGHAALIGEVWKGAAQSMRDVVLLTLGTGVGGAILSGGRLLQGKIGRAGHLGHLSLDPDGAPDICGTPGSLEDAIGNCTLEGRSGGRFSDTRALAEAAAAGDAGAGAVWEKSLRALAAGVTSLINALDPEAVILGGGITASERQLFDPLAELLERWEWRPAGHRVRVLPARLGAAAGACGAARFAINPDDYRIP